MSYPTWPATLPRLHRGGYGEVRMDTRLRRATDLGPPLYERRQTLVPRIIDVRLILTRGEAGVLEAFWRDALSEGVGYFWFPDPMTDGWQILDEDFAPLLDENDVPLLYSALQLTAWGDTPPRLVQLRGQTLTAEFQLVILP